MVDLPDYNKITFKENPPIPLEEIVPDTSPQALDLLCKFLVYPSKQRCSAKQVDLIFIHFFVDATQMILDFIKKKGKKWEQCKCYFLSVLL